MNNSHLFFPLALASPLSYVLSLSAVSAIILFPLLILRQGERLTLTGLGTFSVQQKPARMGRNPRTGAPVKIPPRKAIKFRPTAEVE